MSSAEKHERDEMKAIAAKAARQQDYEKNAQDEISHFLNFVKMALLPGNIELYLIVSEMLMKASLESKLSMVQAGDVAHKATVTGPKSSLLKTARPRIMFKDPANANKPTDFRSKLMPALPMVDTIRRTRTKQTVKQARPADTRQKLVFRKDNLKLKPQTDLSKNQMVNQAQVALHRDQDGPIVFRKKKKKPQDLAPVYTAPKPSAQLRHI